MVCGWKRAIRESPLLLPIMVASPRYKSRHPPFHQNQRRKADPKETETLSSGGDPCARQGSRFHLILRPSNTETLRRICGKSRNRRVSIWPFFRDPWFPISWDTSSRGDPSERRVSIFGVLLGPVGFADSLAGNLIHTPQISAFTTGRFHWNGQPQMPTGIPNP